MTWPRPVPLIGDRTSAQQRAADPTGWALGAEAVAALDEVIGARRDIRRFRPDPVPDALLQAVLSAGHQAPSVGHSQPWRFVVVTEQATRDRAAHLADRERLRQADRLDADRGTRLLDLKLEGIREAPVGVVVACDRRAPAAGVLGRATFADADMWSCACAIENMWLRARAVGLGIGWVTLFEPRDLVELLDIPDGVETLGWLCLGWPDERPPDPGLERAGWSQRVDLQSVVLHERWPAAAAPTAPMSYLRGPGQWAVVAGHDDGDDLLTAPGSLGALDAAVDRVLALPGPPPTTGSLVLAGGHHLVTRYRVSAYPDSVTDHVLDAADAGRSLGATTARRSGFTVQVLRGELVDAPGDLVATDALTTADVDRLLAQGQAAGRAAAATGLVCLGEVGVGNTTVAAVLACALLDLDVESAVGLGVGADAATVERKRDVVTRALARVRAERGAAVADPHLVLAALGGPEFALLVGVTLGAAAAGAAVVLDGLATSVAALLAVRLEPAVHAHLVAGHRSRERAHHAVLVELGLEPLLQLRIRAGEGVGACLAARLLLTGLEVRASAGRVS
ncbi:5,6-dimethylbenzimidazole synthase [uncultured Jatrophihabitans sp.]|uniref:5,6-dimethylbenzimidazole synthase n=1 Tax=uncultured Jatrophihabitans sp. TaxID=1610747 RepID=UPI0035CC944A